MELEFMKLEFPERSYRYEAIKLLYIYIKLKKKKKTCMELEFIKLEFHIKCHYNTPWTQL